MLFLEILECHGCGKLKERRVERLEEMAFFLYKVYDVFLANTYVVNLDSFTEVYKMWRGVKTNLVACFLKY